MAVDAQEKAPSLAGQWSIQEKQQGDQTENAAVKETEVVNLTDVSTEVVIALSPIENPTSDISSPEIDEVPVNEQEDAEEKSEIKIETAPADFRFPTTNQTRHCFTRYIEYHRCVGAKGEDAPDCNKFAKYYRSLCPSEWVERWNEQRENGTFPGPL